MVTARMITDRMDGHSMRETAVCPHCQGRMILVDLTQRTRGERLTFRCEVCREFLIRESDGPKPHIEH
jgi:hypothetical protein